MQNGEYSLNLNKDKTLSTKDYAMHLHLWQIYLSGLLSCQYLNVLNHIVLLCEVIVVYLYHFEGIIGYGEFIIPEY